MLNLDGLYTGGEVILGSPLWTIPKTVIAIHFVVNEACVIWPNTWRIRHETPKMTTPHDNQGWCLKRD